uniref:Restriction endonuclease subunit R n=1 Tax=Globodera pallida TaxID=36090 RepID=A0A183CH75_GLOPA
WKLDVPMLNEQRFVQILHDYGSGFNNIEMLLKNGFNEFLSNFQKKEKSWKIVMPSAIGKMKDEIDDQIRLLNDVSG